MPKIVEYESASEASTKKSHSQSDNSGNKERNEREAQIETVNFMAETSRVRLLRGIILAGDVRQINLDTKADYLVCRRFWEHEAAVTKANANNSFNYQEQFGVINDEAFLRRVDRQHLQLELWRRHPSSNGNGNNEDDLKAFGVVRLPLQQFFIAYRDAAITNHLCKAKLPVISFDAWAPIMSCTEVNERVGDLRCLLAIGSDEQISVLKETRSLDIAFDANEQSRTELEVPKSFFKISATMPVTAASTTTPQLRSTSDLFNLLQRSLNTQLLPQPPPPRMPPDTATNMRAAGSSSVSPMLLKPLQASNIKYFRFLLEIRSANGLPRNPALRGKKKRNNNASGKHQRFPPNEAPSSYVTFQADEGQGPIYKSHEGAVYATGIIEKTTQPVWQESFRVAVSVDYLLNSQKCFILKIWKKAASDSPQQKREQPQPKPMEDAIIGFVALNLSAFLRGQYIAGSFNIVDFNGRVNGQLELRAQPLEDVHKLLGNGRSATAANHNSTLVTPPTASETATATTTTGGDADNFIDEFENTLDLTHLNLGEAIKRKFTELESISQRLRTRLNDVTGEELSQQFDAKILNDWQTIRDNEGLDTFDDIDEFEHDINTTPSQQQQQSSSPNTAGKGAENDACINSSPKD